MYNQQFGNALFTGSQYRGLQQQYQPTGMVQSQYQSPESFHAANYRGSQAGHDNYLRSDSQAPTNYAQNQYQSHAIQQPVIQQQASIPTQSQYQSPESFHTANYRGDQLGHDNYLRSDSQNPTSFGQSQNQFQSQAMQQSSFQAPVQSAESFHTANYRGNQQGHDSYLRSDSQTTAQFAQSQYQPQTNYQLQRQNQTQSFAGAGMSQAASNSFHAANYRGNQQGHDSYLRSDSSQPSSFGGSGYRF